MNPKNKLRENKITLGTWITLGHPSIAEILSQIGFDWIIIDMGHSAITLNEVQILVQSIENSEATPLVRVEENNPNIIKRVIDIGAHGVIVPMINNKEDAIRAVSAVKYPPIGKRGVGFARAQGYGYKFKEYSNWLKTESIVIPIIEHIEGVRNLEAILNIEGIDAFIVGPYDLSTSLGSPGEFDNNKFKGAIEQVKKIAVKKNIPSGFHVIKPSVEEVMRKIHEGFNFIAVSLDTIFLRTFVEDIINSIDNEIKQLHY